MSDVFSIDVEYPRDEAVLLVKAAFERTDGVKQYHDDGDRVLAKTRVGVTSWGEQVVVEYSEQPAGERRTTLSVDSGRELWTNVTANPQRYEARFLDELEALRGRDAEEFRESLDRRSSAGLSKEVASAGELRNGWSIAVGVVLLVTLLGLVPVLFVLALVL